MQYTKGPWEVNTGSIFRDGVKVIDEYYVYAPHVADDVSIAADILDPITGTPSEDNARLIASAPELLEALKGIRSTYVFLDTMTSGIEPQHTNTLTALKKIDMVIQQAEGGRNENF